MPNQFQLSIAKTCDQNWNNFQKTTNGGFCQSCQKEVIDFSKLSDHEIREFFSLNTKSVCGKFNHNQLKTYKSKHIDSAFTHLSKIFIGGFLFLAYPAKASTPKSNSVICYSIFTDSTKTSNQKGFIKIQGTVLDEEGLPVTGSNISLNGTNIGTYANPDGTFILNVEEALLRKPRLLIINFIGYKTVEIVVDLKKEKVQPENVKEISIPTIKLKPDLTMLGKVCITYRKRLLTWPWHKIKNLYSKIRN